MIPRFMTGVAAQWSKRNLDRENRNPALCVARRRADPAKEADFLK